MIYSAYYSLVVYCALHCIALQLIFEATMMEELSERPILANYIDGRTSLLSFLYSRHFTTTLPVVVISILAFLSLLFSNCMYRYVYVPDTVDPMYIEYIPGRCTRRPEDGKNIMVEICSVFFMHSCFVPVIPGRGGGIQHRIEVRVPI